MSLVALIDADILVHRVGFTTQQETLGIAASRLDTMIDGILQADQFTDAEFYLSDSLENNFRLKISPVYKANRKDKEKPVHYDFLKERLIRVWAASIATGMEADDMLGIRQTELEGRSAICSIDKDLLQIPGRHYNFVRDIHSEVCPREGLHAFYLSCLTGDVTDNIKGIYGIGPKKAEQLLPPLEIKPTDEEYKLALMYAFGDKWKKDHPKASKIDIHKVVDEIEVAAKLLWIKRTRSEEVEWSLHRPSLVPLYESIVEKAAAHTRSTERISPRKRRRMERNGLSNAGQPAAPSSVTELPAPLTST
jgi:5'-3' exonuclease